MRKPATATVRTTQPIAGPQLQMVSGGTDPIVIVPSPPSLKAERVQ